MLPLTSIHCQQVSQPQLHSLSFVSNSTSPIPNSSNNASHNLWTAPSFIWVSNILTTDNSEFIRSPYIPVLFQRSCTCPSVCPPIQALLHSTWIHSCPEFHPHVSTFWCYPEFEWLLPCAVTLSPPSMTVPLALHLIAASMTMPPLFQCLYPTCQSWLVTQTHSFYLNA